MDKRPKAKGGAQKERERKRRRLEEEAAKVPKLSNFWSRRSTANDAEESNSGDPPDNSNSVDDQDNSDEREDSRSDADRSNSGDSDTGDQSNSRDSDTGVRSNPSGDDSNFGDSAKAPNDPATFLSKKAAMNDDEKREFVRLGPHQPKCIPPKSIEKYYFESKKVGKSFIQQQRQWLSYSESLDKVFCVVCMVYGDPADLNSLRDGFDNWPNLSHQITKHPNQENHIKSAKNMSTHLCSRDIITAIQSQSLDILHKKQREAALLHDYLKRIIDCLRYECAESSALRGSTERNFYALAGENNYFQPGAGKFLNLINLMSKYDSVLRDKLAEIRSTYVDKEEGHGPKGRGNRVTFLSNDSQTKIIDIMTAMVKQKINEDVKRATFYSFSADGTTDISLVEQMSMVVRYQIPKEGGGVSVIERVIDVQACENTTGEALYEVIKQSITNSGLDPSMCVGCSVDGASNMQGEAKGAITRLKADFFTQALNIYCSAHGTNLMQKGCCRSSVKAVNLYGTDSKPGELQKLRTFFYGNARKRNQVFERAREEKDARKIELAATHSVRFSSMHDATSRVLELYDVILLALTNIISDTNNFDAKVRAEAGGLKKSFECFDTFVTLLFFEKVFETIKPLNILLQTPGLDIALCCAAADKADDTLQRLRDSRGAEIIQRAKTLAQSLGLSSGEFEEKRVNKKRRMDGEVCADERVDDPSHRWVVEVFNSALDSARTILKEKFASQRSTLLALSIFLPANFTKSFQSKPSSDHETKLKAGGFVSQFKLETSADELHRQLREFAGLCEQHRPEFKSDPNLNSFIAVYEYILSTKLDYVYPDLTMAYSIMSTIPTSSCECERTFSRMKIIKDRLANRLTSENLSSRLILSCEQDLMWSLDLDDIIRKFANTRELKQLLFPSISDCFSRT